MKASLVGLSALALALFSRYPLMQFPVLGSNIGGTAIATVNQQSSSILAGTIVVGTTITTTIMTAITMATIMTMITITTGDTEHVMGPTLPRHKNESAGQRCPALDVCSD